MTQLIIKEDKSQEYPPRTYYNAKSSDTTLAIATDLTTKGELLTKKAAGAKYIGFEINNSFDTLKVARELYLKMKNDNSHKLNIAGNGIYTLIKSKINQEEINNIVYRIVAQVHAYWPIEKIYTGGQTGVDLAGAVAAYALHIEAEITLPKGYRQRFENNIDVYTSQENVLQQIINGASKLEPYTIYTKNSKKNNI
jgi:hypothetical protein